MTTEDKKVDEWVKSLCGVVTGLILTQRILNMVADEHKDQKPRHKPKGRWRYKQYEEEDTLQVGDEE